MTAVDRVSALEGSVWVGLRQDIVGQPTPEPLILTAEEAFELAAKLQFVATRAMIADAAVPLYED